MNRSRARGFAKLLLVAVIAVLAIWAMRERYSHAASMKRNADAVLILDRRPDLRAEYDRMNADGRIEEKELERLRSQAGAIPN